MIKKVTYIFFFSIVAGLFLSACSNKESLNEKWHTKADEESVILRSNSGQSISFSEKGMSADYTQISEEDPRIFPFEKGKLYSTYTVIQEEGNIIIGADNNNELQYVLKIKGDRLYEDERNNVTYTTDSYLLETEKEDLESAS